MALNALSRKATGVDGLGHDILRNPLYRDAIVTKLLAAFRKWWSKLKVPSYMKKARIVPLSKEDTAYPKVGNIRTISVLPSTYKLFEKIVYWRLDDFIQKEAPLHPT